MTLSKLILTDNTYSSPRRSFQGIRVKNLGNIQKSLEFAKNMTFGDENSAFHRKSRSGGIEVRNQNQLFENTFQGKLSEFILYEYFKFHKLDSTEPDLETFGKGVWDSGDLKVQDKNINVKSIKHFSSLLLLELKDWNQEGFYIHNNQHYEFFFVVRVKLPFRDLNNYQNLEVKDFQNKIFFDIPGYITNEMLRLAIKNNHIIKQGYNLNSTKTKIDADNFYIHLNDFLPIKNFLID